MIKVATVFYSKNGEEGRIKFLKIGRIFLIFHGFLVRIDLL